MKKSAILFLLCSLWAFNQAQSPKTDSIPHYTIGLVLPFQTQSTVQNIDDFFTASDFYTASRIELNSYAVEALNFYQGLRLALHQNQESIHIDLHVFDCWNSDSVTTELLKNPQLKKCDLIIGPSSTSNARLMAEYCKENHILNVQPFTPSKSLTDHNPYHLKLASTIDAHVDDMFLSILDSFSSGHVIIYAPNTDIGTSTAERFDSLFRDYNRQSNTKFTITKLTVSDLNSPKEKKGIADYLKKDQENIIIITSFAGSFVNGSLGALGEKAKGYQVALYGMPTWLSSPIIRLDYLHNLNCRISDGFYADTTNEKTRTFNSDYTGLYSASPTEMSYLGYDVMNFLLYALNTYGKDFTEQIVTQRFTGTAYKFDIMREMNADGQIDYYENRHVNVFMMDDYQLRKIY